MSSKTQIQWPVLMGGVKQHVVEALAAKPGSSALDAFKLVKKTSPKAASYQAVHKALGQLVKEGVAEKTQAGYRLSDQWVSDLEAVGRTLSQSTAGQLASQACLVFNSVHESDSFLFNAAAKLFKPGEVVCTNWSHFWIPLFLNNATYSGLKTKISTVKSYATTPSNTPLDRWCANYWAGRGVRHKLGCTWIRPVDVAVIGDWVLQVHYPFSVRKEMDKEYARVKSIRDFDADWFFQRVMAKKVQVPVIISRNAAFANQVRSEIMGAFKGVRVP